MTVSYRNGGAVKCNRVKDTFKSGAGAATCSLPCGDMSCKRCRYGWYVLPVHVLC